MELTVILGDVGFKSQLKIYIILNKFKVCAATDTCPYGSCKPIQNYFSLVGGDGEGVHTLLPLADSFYRIILQMQSCVRGVGVNQLNNPSVPAWESNNRCVVVSDCVIARSR